MKKIEEILKNAKNFHRRFVELEGDLKTKNIIVKTKNSEIQCTMNGQQKVMAIDFDESYLGSVSKVNLENDLKDLINEAINRTSKTLEDGILQSFKK